MSYKLKYIKYKNRYLSIKNNAQVGGNNTVIHVAGSQGSGKTTLGKRLSDKYGDKIHVFDLDDFSSDYQKNKDKYGDYQTYLNDIIKTNGSKPIIFVGLDAEMCLGLMEDSDKVYNLQSTHNYYIKSSDITLKQRFYRQIDKLEKRKEWFFDEWLKNPKELQEKIFRFVDLDKWKVNNSKCDDLYRNRGYSFLESDVIFSNICEILDKTLTHKS